MTESSEFEFHQLFDPLLHRLANIMTVTSLLLFGGAILMLTQPAAVHFEFTLGSTTISTQESLWFHLLLFVGPPAFLGVLLLGAAGSFRRIATTQGSDITHLLRALRNLKFSYLILDVGLTLWFIAFLAIFLALLSS